MYRTTLLILPLLVACQGEIGINEIGDTDVEEEIDLQNYEGATLRIVQPASAAFIPWAEQHEYVAELIDAEGTPLTFDEVVWTSEADPAWTPVGMTFTDDTIDIGMHNITAQVELPNGDRVAHTVGGVLVQHELAGTYVGTFITSMSFQNIPIACAGASVLIVDPYGKDIDGTSTCIASAGGFEINMDFTIDAENDDGEVAGSATGRIIAFDVDFDAVGTLPGDESLNLDIAGDVFGNEMTGGIKTERLSRDAGL